jgi:3-hydroxy-9,10-secoandrosta-1,3,5(10)-triene-9,17-dione monooxygenase
VTSIQQRDAQSVLDGIDELLPKLRQRAQETEDLRRLPDATVSELQEIGFFKLLQPQQWGGLECDPAVFYEAVRRLASACGSTGWVSSIIGVHNWHLALFDQQAQDEVWGDDTDVRVSSSYAPMGAGTVVDGGYLVSGSWNWSSGCDHATWAFLGGPVIKDGRPVDFGSFLIPRTEYRIDDVWHVVGLRGTGSNTVVVKDVFVPRHRFLSYKAMNDGTAGGYQNNTAAVYKMPWGTMHPTTISAPIVGMAYGAYDAHVEHQGKRVRAAFAGEKAKDDPFAKVRIAEAATSTHCCRRARRFRSTYAPALVATRCARPVGPSPQSTGCSRLPVPRRWPMTHRCNVSGVTRTPAGCTRPTTPSGPTRFSVTMSSGCRPATPWSDARRRRCRA